MGGQDLEAAVRHCRVRVENASGDLHELSRVAYKQQRGKAQATGLVDGCPDVVGTGHEGHVWKSHDLMHVALPVVAGNQDEVTVALRILDPELDFDGLDEGLLAHGTDDPRGAQNRNAAFDTQAGIEGVGSDTFALGYENLYREATRVAA